MLRGRLTIRSIMFPRAGLKTSGSDISGKTLLPSYYHKQRKMGENFEKFERNRLTGKKQYYIILNAL